MSTADTDRLPATALADRLRDGLGQVTVPSLQRLAGDYVVDRWIAEQLRLLAAEEDEHLRYFRGILAPTLTWWLVADLIADAGMDPAVFRDLVAPERTQTLIDEGYGAAVAEGAPLESPEAPSPEALEAEARSLLSLLGGHGAEPELVETVRAHLADFRHDWSLIVTGRRFLTPRDPVAGSLATEYLQVAAGFLVGAVADHRAARAGAAPPPSHIVPYDLLAAVMELLEAGGPSVVVPPEEIPATPPPPVEVRAEDRPPHDGPPARAPQTPEVGPSTLLTERVWRHVMSGPMYVARPFELLQGLVDAMGRDAALDALHGVLSPWHKRYDMLVRLIQAHGYEIRGFHHFAPGEVRPKTVFLHHDVHVRDLVPALALAIENRRRGISSTFFLNWDYNVIDVFYRDGYAFFRNVAGEHAQVGFHGSPVASWLCHEVFGGDETAYFDWIDTRALEETTRFVNASDPGVRFMGQYSEAGIAQGVEAWLRRSLDDMRAVFGEIEFMSHHGDNLSVRLAKDWGLLDPERRRLFRTNDFMTPERLERVGLVHVLHLLRGSRIPRRYTETPNLGAYLQNLDAQLATGRTFGLLNHPWGLKEDDDRMVFDEDFFHRRMEELGG